MIIPFDTTEFDSEAWDCLILSGRYERINFLDGNRVVGLDSDQMTKDERRERQQPLTLRLEDLVDRHLVLLPRETTTLSTVADDDLREDLPTSDASNTPVKNPRELRSNLQLVYLYAILRWTLKRNLMPWIRYR